MHALAYCLPILNYASGRRINIPVRILHSGATVNQADFAGWTPLHIAAYFNKVDICFILVKYGSDPNKFTRKGKTAFDVTSSEFLKEVIECIFRFRGCNDVIRHSN
jgi:ankyrin repeat protein